MRSSILVAAFALMATAAPGIAAAQAPVDPRPANGAEQKPAVAGQTDAPENKSNVAFDLVTVVEGLQNPWSMTWLPNGTMLVTERPGRLRVLSADGKLSAPVTGLPPVDARNQGGLLDVALDPAFAKNNLIYWSYAEPRDAGANNTAVARGTFVDDAAAPRVENVQVIYHQSPSLVSTLHFGSRLVFGRDGTLFITQGERSITDGRMQAQKMDSGLGKIMRINPDGSIPTDNPFVGKEGVQPSIWSSGHRNVHCGDAQPGDRRAVGSRARHARRRRDQHRAQGQGLRLVDDRIRHRVSRRPHHRQHHAAGGDGAAVVLLGSGHRAERHDVLHRQSIPGVEGQSLHRRTRHEGPGARGA